MTVYASRADFFLRGIPSTARGRLSDDQIDGALADASAFMDSKFRGRYALPLVAWGPEITQKCCEVAAYYAMQIRGYNPASGADVNILQRYQLADEWLDKVQRQAAHPDVTPQATQSPTFNRPTVISSSSSVSGGGASGANRGW